MCVCAFIRVCVFIGNILMRIAAWTGVAMDNIMKYTM